MNHEKSYRVNYFSVLLFGIMIAVLASALYASTGQLSFKGRVINGTPITTVAVIVNSTSMWAFQNGNVVKYVAYVNSTCTPNAATEYNLSTESLNSGVSCESGTGGGVYITGASPRWNLVPTFAGWSVYGVNSWGSNAMGYPVYNGMALWTQCGASGSTSGCGKAAYFYSPLAAVNERAIGVYNGINGWPEGVLPISAHDELIPSNKNSTVTRSYRVSIAVYDPNIFPNATGQCHQVAPSSLGANATSNCLTSVNALMAALVTPDNALSTINGNNVLWNNAGNVMMQAALLTVSVNGAVVTVHSNTNVSTPNTNMQSYTYMATNAPATTVTVVATTVTVVATTVAQVTTATNQTNSTTTGTSSGSSSTLLYAVVGIVVILVIAFLAWRMMKK